MKEPSGPPGGLSGCSAPEALRFLRAPGASVESEDAQARWKKRRQEGS
jgi:hypothetical protein